MEHHPPVQDAPEGQPAQDPAEHQQQQDPGPEHRHRNADQDPHHRRGIDDRVGPAGREDADRQPEDDGKEQGGEAQLDRRRKRLPDLPDRRLTGPERDAEVADERARQEPEVLHGHRR